MESFRSLVRTKPVSFKTEAGVELIFREDGCTVSFGGKFLDIPAHSYVAVARLLEQADQLMRMQEKGRSR